MFAYRYLVVCNERQDNMPYNLIHEISIGMTKSEVLAILSKQFTPEEIGIIKPTTWEEDIHCPKFTGSVNQKNCPNCYYIDRLVVAFINNRVSGVAYTRWLGNNVDERRSYEE